MRSNRLIVYLIAGIIGPSTVLPAQEKTLETAKDGSGIVGYKDTPVQPWSGYHVHDPDRPEPVRITPGDAGAPPSDAVILFDGGDLSQWESSDWTVENGAATAAKGHLVSKQQFGDMQMHLEWRTPGPPQGRMFDQGNSGVLLMGLFEIQIFDSWTNNIYPDGQAASVYGQTPPLVNACREPGAWQSYDILFTAPVYKFGQLVSRARVTVLHNGVVVHNHTEIMGTTPHRVIGYYPPPVQAGPVVLMGHNNPVQYRNVWVRRL